MILKVQIQHFGTSAGKCTLKFSFSKILGTLNFIIFCCENWHEASFYIKEQVHICFGNLRLKYLFLLPPKKHVFGY